MHTGYTKRIAAFLCLAVLFCTLAGPAFAISLPMLERFIFPADLYEVESTTHTEWSSANPSLTGTVTSPFHNACVHVLEKDEILKDLLKNPVSPANGNWNVSGDRTNTDVRLQGQLQYLSAVASPAEQYISFSWSSEENMMEASSVAFGLRIDPIKTDRHRNVDVGKITVKVNTACGHWEETGEVYLEAGSWVVVNSALPMNAGNQPVDTMTVRLEYENSGVPLSVQITNPHRSDKDCVFVEQFSASVVSGEKGTLETSSRWLYMTPDDNGEAALLAETELPQYVPYAASWYMMVTVENTTAGGTIRVEPQSNGEPDIWLGSAVQQVKEGSHTYLFPLQLQNDRVKKNGDTLTAGMYTMANQSAPDTFRISFKNVSSIDSSYFRISKIAFCSTEEPQWQEGNLGSLEQGRIENGEMVWNGKLTRQTAAAYREAEIVLKAVSVWDRYNLRGTKELDSVQVSNSYTFSVPVEGNEQYGAGWLFYAELRSKTKGADGRDIVTHMTISQPKMLAGTPIEPCTLSMFGFHDASTVGVYESNVSHVTVDVVWDKLFVSMEQGIQAGFGGSTISLSPGYLAELDQDIRFFCDAGLEVGLRLVTEKGGTLPHADTAAEAGQYRAAIWYLCSRYPAVSSIVLGHGINCEEYSSGSLDYPERVYPHVATLAAVTYQTARLVIPDIYIVVPFADNRGYEDAAAAGGASLEAETALILFAISLEKFGNIPWAASWRMEDDSEAAEAAAMQGRWKQVLQSLSLPVFSAFLYRWEPDTCLQGEPAPYDLTNRYEALCRTLHSVHPRAVILSLTHVADAVSQGMYGRITELRDPEGTENAVRKVQKLQGSLQISDMTETEMAMTAICDFTDSYTRQGFVAGSGIRKLYTHRLPAPTPETGGFQRVLRSELPMFLFENMRVGRSGGVLLRNFNGDVDLSQVDYLTFTYTLTEKGSSRTTPSVIFLVGAEDFRAEYKVEGTVSGDVMTAVCDLRQYEHAPVTEYIGVMLYGEAELCFDLSSVKAWSSQLTTEELEAVFASPALETPSPYEGEVVTMIILVTISSVCILVLLLRRDREEEGRLQDGKNPYR